VWTLKAQGKKRTTKTTDSLCALPSKTHMAIVELQKRNICKYLISQNCDGLHRRSGIDPNKISELHGNGNIEYCEDCGYQYLRDFHAYRIGRGRDHYTGRHCVVPTSQGKQCNGRLMESTIDFGQSLPEVPLQKAFQHSQDADLHLVLGSSLTVRPACTMPKITSKKGNLVIVNLQKTPLDDRAAFHIYSKTDVVMELLFKELNLTIPEWSLTRFMKIKLKPLPLHNSFQFCVKGIERGSSGQEIPASIFSKVEILLPEQFPKKERGIVLEEEPFKITKKNPKYSLKDAQAVVRLHFMGHYCEPPLDINVNLLVEKKREALFLLSYNPKNGVWSVAKESESVWKGLDTRGNEEEEEEEDMKVKGMEIEEESGIGLSLSSRTDYSSIFSDPNLRLLSRDVSFNCVDSKGKSRVSDDEDVSGGEGDLSQVSGRLWGSSAIASNSKNHKVLVYSGGAARGDSDTHLVEFNLQKKTWCFPKVKGDSKGNLPFINKARWCHSSTTLLNNPSLVYFIAGWDGSSQYNDVHVYDVISKTLSRVSTSGESPSHRGGHSATAVDNDKIFVFGGACCSGGPYVFFDDSFVFNPTNNHWTKIPVKGKKPSKRAQHAAVFLEPIQTVLIIGGFDGTNVLNDVWGFSLTELTWKEWITRGCELPAERGLSQSNFRVLPASSAAFLMEASGASRKAKYVVYYSRSGAHVLNCKGWEWGKVGSNLRPMGGFSAALLDDHSFVFYGGIDVRDQSLNHSLKFVQFVEHRQLLK